MATFEIGEHDFLLDGHPHQIISGALHYFRVHPAQWADRIHKARLMGLNAIETYVAWNFHSPEPGRFDTDGPRDLGRFLLEGLARGAMTYDEPERRERLLAIVKRAVRMLNRKGDVHDLWE